jgi:dTDP-4-dehydrorhamnose reductase
MKVLITGASGLVGYALFQSSKKSNLETIGTYFGRKINREFFQLDINDKDQLDKLIRKVMPEVIVHTVALTNVDFCENHRKEAWKINVEGTRNIVEKCLERGAKPVYISTDYVFDGNSGPYREDANTNPINYYGVTKLEGEKIVSSLSEYLIIRTTWVFDCNFDEKNFAIRLVNSLKDGKLIKVPNDQFGNPTLARNLADAIIELILKNRSGIYNIVGLTRLSRYEFALKLANAFGFDKNLIFSVTTEQLSQIAKRPKLAGLIPDKVQKELKNTKLLSLDEAIEIFKEEVTKKWKIS